MNTAFIPLVPQASSGRRGMLSQRSTAFEQMPAHVPVVVLQQHDVVVKGRVAPHLHESADDRLAAVVGRVGLAGEDHLDGACGVREQRLGAIDVLEEQVPALVCGETARDPDRQHVEAQIWQPKIPSDPIPPRLNAALREVAEAGV